MLSILSGKFKGQKLSCPKTGTRPTSSLVKKALFDKLRMELQDVVFCDLFAGSGAVGLEALSQGAKKAIFIEANRQAFTHLKSNIEKLKCADQTETYFKPARKYLDQNLNHLATIDVFFLDPPYEISKEDSSSYESLLNFLSDAVLKPSCLIICETKDPKRIEAPLSLQETLHLESKSSYGDSYLFILRKP